MTSRSSSAVWFAPTEEVAADDIRPSPSHVPSRAPSRPASRPSSRPQSRHVSTPRSPPSVASSSGYQVPGTSGGHQAYFRSRRINPDEADERPWLHKKDSRQKWHRIFPLIGIGLGICFTALLCWQGYSSVENYQYCPVYMEDFSGGALNEKIWTKEVQVGGFGNGQFEETTVTDENVFVKNGELWIQPSLQDANLVEHNTIINLTHQGLCTSTLWSDCVAATNVTNGTIVNPVKSARINTKKGAAIQYGRVEVEALLPAGDWLWPAIWMLPVKSTYGDWPASGEIDIAESRGNNHTYPLGGNNIASGTLHWGPDADDDAWYHTFEKKTALHTTFSAKYHTFGLEWSPKYIFTYIDSRLIEALYVPFSGGSLWDKGNFPSATQNGTRIVDPWSQTGRPSTPFDQPFYLILNVAVGSTNAWWKDGVQNKPWVDASPTAMKDFWDAREQWLPTWKDNGQMRVKSVKMWQQAGFQGCGGT